MSKVRSSLNVVLVRYSASLAEQSRASAAYMPAFTLTSCPGTVGSSTGVITTEALALAKYSSSSLRIPFVEKPDFPILILSVSDRVSSNLLVGLSLIRVFIKVLSGSPVSGLTSGSFPATICPITWSNGAISAVIMGSSTLKVFISRFLLTFSRRFAVYFMYEASIRLRRPRPALVE